MMEGISHRWRLLSGQENWKNLLDPLDIDVRRYIIHYGEMVQATYDTFNSEKLSRYCETMCLSYVSYTVRVYGRFIFHEDLTSGQFSGVTVLFQR